jgi:hypothetical protein
LLCPLCLAGCVGNSDPPPIPKLPAPGRFAAPGPEAAQTIGHNAGRPDGPVPPGAFFLPSKYMLMTPANSGNPDRPPNYRPVAVPQGVPATRDAAATPTKR